MRRKKRLQSVWILLGVAVVSWQIWTPSAFSASAPGVTDDTITIGLTTPMTGPASLYGKCGDMYEAMFLEWGKGINGRTIKLIKYDDMCDPVRGLAAIKKLVYDENIFMLSSGQCSNMCLAVKPIIEKEGIPFVSHGCITDAMYVPVVKNIFNPAYISTSASRSKVDFAMTIPGAKKFGVIRHTDEWGTSLYKPLIDYLKDQFQLTPAVDVALERGSADATTQVLKLKHANVDAVFSILFHTETTVFLREAQKLGLDVPIIGSTATSVSDQYANLKSLEPLKKYFGPFSIRYPLDSPKVKVYERLFEKYHSGKKFDAFTIFGTGGPLVIMDALRKCGRDVTREKFIDILETQYKNWDPENYIGAVPLTFSKTDHVGMNRIIMSTISTGKFEIIKTYQDYEKLIKQSPQR